MVVDDACAQDSDNNAVPTGSDLYDTPERFEMVSLYCLLSYIRTCIYICSTEAISFFMEPLLCVQIQLQLTP